MVLAVVIFNRDIEKLEETMEELTKLEFVERQNVERDLREFQRNRRKLVFDVISLQVSKVSKLDDSDKGDL